MKDSAGKNPSGCHGGNLSPKGIEGSGSAKNDSCDQLGHSMTDIRTYAGQEDVWEVMAKKYESQAGGNTTNQWGSWENLEAANKGTGEPQGKDWGEAVDSRRKDGKVNSMAHSSGECWFSACIAHQHQWLGPAKSSSFSSQSKVSEDGRNQSEKASEGVIQGVSSGGYHSGSYTTPVQLDDGSGSDDFEEDIDDDLSGDSDSDVSSKSYETRKKNTWFRLFFETLDNLSVDQINEPTRRWHCPACQHGPGSIAWYKGLQSLMTHAKTKGAERIKLHREFAELLEEELPMRGISVILAGEAFGQWKGLHETSADHDIVWPPMVVVMNTVLEQDENDKWVGMGSEELLEYFASYAAVKARHSYGPHGHRGISVLIFEASPIGYMEAERLHKHFAHEGKDREAWEHRRILFYPGGKRQLYGFLAHKEDMDEFNRHSQGRLRLKFEMISHQKMVVDPMRQMSEDNRQLLWVKNNVAKLQQHSEALGDTFKVLSQKLQEAFKENRILMLRMKMQHKENKEKTDQEEQFFEEQMDKVKKATEEQEMIFKKLLQEVHLKSKQRDAKEEERLGEVVSAKLVDVQVKEVERIFTESGRLEHVHGEYKMMALTRGHLEDAVNAEKAIDEGLSRLVVHVPGASEAPGCT